MRYIIAPLDLTDEQSHIYKLLYKKADFKTREVKYTKEQLLVDSNPIFKLTIQKIRTILKYFIKENFLREIHKGSKGHPTVYEIVTIKELMFNQQLNNNNATTKQLLTNYKEVEAPMSTEIDQQLNNSNITTIQQLNNNPIKEKEKDKEKDKEYIYTLEKEIFDYWNSKVGTVTSKETSFDKNKITTITKKYKKEEVFKAIDRLDNAVLDKDYYYNFKWNIYKFFKQANGISNWLDDGQLFNDFKTKGEGANNGFTGKNTTESKSKWNYKIPVTDTKPLTAKEIEDLDLI